MTKFKNLNSKYWEKLKPWWTCVSLMPLQTSNNVALNYKGSYKYIRYREPNIQVYTPNWPTKPKIQKILIKIITDDIQSSICIQSPSEVKTFWQINLRSCMEHKCLLHQHMLWLFLNNLQSELTSIAIRIQEFLSYWPKLDHPFW